MEEKKIARALISVFHKDGLEMIVRKLHELNVELISTGGTEAFIHSLGIPVLGVETLTAFPEMLGGRVKTLHPVIFGGILGRRDHLNDIEQMTAHNILPLDLVIVDLYPFEETVKSMKSESENEEAIIEKIDIGGVALIRAAAKNFNDVLVCAGRNDYGELLSLLNSKSGFTSYEDRRRFAANAFNITSHYDTQIFNHFNESVQLPVFKQSILQSKKLRYGENPHQHAQFFGNFEELFSQLNGKEISYNNLVDIDAAVHLIQEFENTTCAIIKHTNPCGVAEAENTLEAWDRALACDPVSAFGGVIIFNRKIEEDVAKKLHEFFFEVLIAPAYEDEALKILKQKKNRIILHGKWKMENGKWKFPGGKKIFKTILNGAVEQEANFAVADIASWKVVTKKSPAENEIPDLLFAEKCVKHLKSNAIVLAKDRQMIGMGSGQTSRVEALKLAIAKANLFSST